MQMFEWNKCPLAAAFQQVRDKQAAYRTRKALKMGGKK